jgi:HSP90 family molecular chaperone
MSAKKTLEINPFHPIIAQMSSLAKVPPPSSTPAAANPPQESPKDEKLADAATLLYDTAMLNAGFTIEKSHAFADRVYRVIRSDLGVEEGAAVEEPVEVEAEAERVEAAVEGAPKEEL